MKKTLAIAIRIAIMLAVVLIIVLGRWLLFHDGPAYNAPATGMTDYESIVVPQEPISEFNDVYKEGTGIVLVDLAHRNAFDKEEINVLVLRLISRGLTIKFLTTEDDLKEELLGSGGGEETTEEPVEETMGAGENSTEETANGETVDEEVEKVPGADAFIVISPRNEFSKEEKETVGKFVDGGGKLLLIADPTRYSEMNSLSLDFGLLFESDYLYNVKEHETNYKNIFITDFKENEVTKGLEKIALYTAGSISSANSSIAFVDENTFSNVVETRQKLSPIALNQESGVLAIYDLTFITEPYNGILDNNRLISNAADWLMPATDSTETK